MCTFKIAESIFWKVLVHKRNTKHSIWYNFGLLATQDGKVIETEQGKVICKKGVHVKGSNTPIIFEHLPEHHSLVYADIAPSSSKVKLVAKER